MEHSPHKDVTGKVSTLAFEPLLRRLGVARLARARNCRRQAPGAMHGTRRKDDIAAKQGRKRLGPEVVGVKSADLSRATGGRRYNNRRQRGCPLGIG